MSHSVGANLVGIAPTSLRALSSPTLPTKRATGMLMRHAAESSIIGAPLAPSATHRHSSPTTVCSASPPSSTAAASTLSPATAPVKAVLFDMDGVLCNSEIVSRKAAAEVMAELYGLTVDPDEFMPFTGTGEANFLGGVARKYGAPFEVESCKAKFFEIYMAKYAVPGAGIGYKGARELVQACRAAGLRTAVASSADLVKVHANLGAADIPLDLFDAIVSADLFERLKPFPDIFLAAASQLGVDPASCVVIEDAVAGVEAARAAGMRVIGVVTTLAEDAMETAAPDVILPQISNITVETLTGIKLREGGEEAIAAAKAKSLIAATASSAIDTSAAQPSTSDSSSASDGVQAWLNEYVSLPAGYRTTRRDALKFVSLGAALTSGYVSLTRAKANGSCRSALVRFHLPILIQVGIVAYVVAAWGYLSKSLSYTSPKALLNALLPRAMPTTSDTPGAPVDRVAAFKRFIGDLERRGGGEQVPEFPLGADWLNAPPLRLDRELRGKVLVLDFWTYCCINCMHILPDLAYLENKFAGQPVTVVGVHSAKFDNEQDTAAIRSAVLRYDIRHPVINDRGMELWRALGVSSWPTLAVVSPTGKLIVSLAGEGHREDLKDIITAALEYYGEEEMLDATPVPQALERDKDPRLTASPLRFPGKVAIDGIGQRLFISDSGNHRIVATDLAGTFIAAYGGNGPGLRDGDALSALFNRPQGIAYSAATDCLYVCDTDNHALREIDLKSGQVRTLVGDGIKAEGDFRGGASGSSQRLNSPWDCIILQDPGVILVAMAGQHQIWKVDIGPNGASAAAAAVSGTGAERNQNGPTGLTSAWAQPSGLTLVQSGGGAVPAVLVADSESSTIRRLDLTTGGAAACVGGDPLFSDNLFKFGDADGVGPSALLQHPLAVAATPSGDVYVADSYNHKLKRLDPSACSITTVAGSGQAGFSDGRSSTAQLSEPGGLAIGPNNRVFIADTNNFLIRVYDPDTANLSTLQLRNVPKPQISPDKAAAWTGGDIDGDSLPPGATLVKAQEPIAMSSDGKLNVTIALPVGYHLTQGANSRFECSSVGGGGIKFTPVKGPLRESSTSGGSTAVTAQVQFDASEAQACAVRVLCTVYFCQDKSVCLFKEVVFEVELAKRGVDAASFADLSFTLSAQSPQVNLPNL